MAIDLTSVTYPFDPTGKLASNKITGEQQIITGANFRDYHFIVPKLAPFFADSMVVKYRDTNGVVRTLVEGIDYYLTHWFIAASRACAKDVFGSISFLDTLLSGVVTLEYQTIGGIWTQNDAKLAEILADKLNNPRTTSWDVIVDMPVTFPVIDHEWDLADMVGQKEVTEKLAGIEDALRQTGETGIAAHIENRDNPHGVSKAQVGLAQVRDLTTATQIQAEQGTTDDAYMTPLRTSQAINKQALTPLTAHVNRTDNPHGTTAAQVGAYSKTEADALLAGKVSTNGTAYNTDRFDGRGAVDFKDWVLAGTSANTLKFNGMTYGEVLAAILAGKTADSYKLEGRTYDQLVTELSGGVAQNTLRFDGRTYAEAKTDILSGTATNAAQFASRTYAQAKADILTGKAADSTLFDGRTFAAAATEILLGKAGDSAKLDGKTYAQLVSELQGGVATNALQFDGRTYAQAKADILTGKAADSTLFNGMTYAAAKADILNGKAADSAKLDGKTYAEVKADVLTGRAADSSRFDGKTYSEAKADILTGTAANAVQFDGRDFMAVKTDILTGKAADSAMFDGKTYTQAKTDILSGKSADSGMLEGRTAQQFVDYLDTFYADIWTSVQQYEHPKAIGNPGANLWTAFATVENLTASLSASAGNLSDAHFIITGGAPVTTAGAHTAGTSVSGMYALRVSFSESNGATPFVVESSLLNGKEAGLRFGYTYNTTTGKFTLYARSAGNRDRLSVTDMSRDDLAIMKLVPIEDSTVTVEPSGIVYGAAARKVAYADEVEAALDALTAAFNELKTQVAD